MREIQWQPYCEFRPLVWHAGDGGFSAMGFDDGFYEAQTEAEATLGAAFVATIKAGPDFVLLFGRNADAGVSEGYACVIPFGAHGDGYLAVFWGIFDGVVE